MALGGSSAAATAAAGSVAAASGSAEAATAEAGSAEAGSAEAATVEARSSSAAMGSEEAATAAAGSGSSSLLCGGGLGGGGDGLSRSVAQKAASGGLGGACNPGLQRRLRSGAYLLGASLLPYPNPKQGVEQWLKPLLSASTTAHRMRVANRMSGCASS